MTFKKENYTTTLQKAKMLVPGFKEAFSHFDERLVLDQCSKSVFKNYGRNLAFDIEQCPCCKTGKMIIVQQFGANAPPKQINDKRKNQIVN